MAKCAKELRRHADPSNSHGLRRNRLMERNEASPAPAGTGKWKKRILVCISSLTVVAVCIALRSFGGREQADAQAPVSRSGAQPGRMPPPDQQPRSGSATPRAQTTGV